MDREYFNTKLLPWLKRYHLTTGDELFEEEYEEAEKMLTEDMDEAIDYVKTCDFDSLLGIISISIDISNATYKTNPAKMRAFFEAIRDRAKFSTLEDFEPEKYIMIRDECNGPVEDWTYEEYRDFLIERAERFFK